MSNVMDDYGRSSKSFLVFWDSTLGICFNHGIFYFPFCRILIFSAFMMYSFVTKTLSYLLINLVRNSRLDSGIYYVWKMGDILLYVDLKVFIQLRTSRLTLDQTQKNLISKKRAKCCEMLKYSIKEQNFNIIVIAFDDTFTSFLVIRKNEMQQSKVKSRLKNPYFGSW